ncbi:methyltransferase domain-containing protein [Nonomuraea jabiensis]|uniref:Protein-L-isoaspartate O-methyltransferase n=1 Tax=Nonomuraea jabiensis TaxID=882448 RepID=A0A7W9G7I1_9ACTN|nr:methyltransferase domain-containing protein [Nonomuraea jabiensis]MBB5778567.1 protein-L-isoaspartate(D-aspartate) O-methyltransferase [Nonomuraea jabiensis]
MTPQNVGQRIEQMIAEIPPAAQRTERIFDAMRAVPRHPFIPRYAQALLGAAEVEQIIDRDADPEAWWNAVYSDSVIVTQVSDGAGEIMPGSNDPTSSASAPSTVADLLGWLDPVPGQSVLEIGTGTGWTAALLTHLLGEHGSVTTIEVDEAVAEQAAKNVVAAGAQPHMIIGDGAKGCPDRAPFDRVHVTCGVRTVPYAWVEQTRPGGVIVLPYCPGLGNGHGLRLTVMPDGTAHGRFPGFAAYMMMRSQRPPDAIPDDGNGQDLTTRIDPRTIAYAPAGALLAMAALTGLQVTFKGEGDQLLLWVMDQSDPGVWTLVTYTPGHQEYEVYQLGDRPLWDEVTGAYFRWVSWGEPGRDSFGMSVTPDGQRIWLDAPERAIQFPLPRGS